MMFYWLMQKGIYDLRIKLETPYKGSKKNGHYCSMIHSIEVFLQPPSPKQTKTLKLPPIDTLCSFSLDPQTQTVRSPSTLSHDSWVGLYKKQYVPKLDILEPNLARSPRPGSPSPLLGIMSSPPLSSITSTMSPFLSPTESNSSLLMPPEATSARRCLLTPDNALSPSCRFLSEPPAFEPLPPAECPSHPLFGPKRKRGRPPNTSRPESSADQPNWTFMVPTVWDVKKKDPSIPITAFTSTRLDMTLSIPKKKRGRKPKKQLAGNSCFVWKDLTAPRGANKKRMISLEIHKE
ncbi:hypothetical protein BY458DRAFT_486072 [Sporodiniella umbellata]|nr:hypothetical protein BY458DRAFT_486072 [Sporodiniella umbellata]